MAITAGGVTAGAAVLGAGATAVATQNQAEAGRRADTRARGVAASEAERQRRKASLIASQEEEAAKKVGARLRATAGNRAGRRSLVFNPTQQPQQSPSQLASQQTLG